MSGIWMDVDAALAEVPVNAMPLISDSDFKTIQTSVAYNASGMALYWHFVTTAGVYTVTAVTPTTSGTYDWAHQSQGMYSIEIPASGGASINNDTEGFGWFTGVATGVLPWRGPTIGFRAAALNDALIDNGWSTTRGLAGTALPNAAADAAGGLPVSDAGGLDLDTKLNHLDVDVSSRSTYAGGAVASVTGNVGGNVTGSVGSVVGAVGSVTGNLGGNVNGNVAGSVASVAGAVGSVSGSVGSVAGDVGGKVIGGGSGTITGDGVQAASVTGSVGSVAGAVGSVSGAVGSVTGNVGGNVAGDVQGKVIGGGAGSITGDGVRASAVTGAVGSVTGSVGSVVGAVGSVTAGVTISGTLATLDAIWLKIKAWLRLTLRNDAPIAADHAAELAEINQNMGTGAGTYDPTTDAQQAPVSVTLGPDDIQDIVDGVSQGLSFPTAEDIAAELAGNNVVATFPLLIEGEETVIIQGEDYFDADGNAARVTINATGIEAAVSDGWDFVFWGQGDSSGQVVTGSPSSGGANTITVKFDLPAAKTSLVTAGLGGWRVVHKPTATTRRFSEVEGLLRVKPTK